MEQVTSILNDNASIFFSWNISDVQSDYDGADLIGSNRASPRPERMAVRIRRNHYFEQFHDVTFRSYRVSGAKTEIDKIRDGGVDWYFYGWTDEKDEIANWVILDVNKVLVTGLLDGRQMVANHDCGRTGFVSVPLFELDANNCILAKHYTGVLL